MNIIVIISKINLGNLLRISVNKTILLILMALDDKNFNQLHPFFLQIVITSLNQIGLGEKAFDLAIETIIEI